MFVFTMLIGLVAVALCLVDWWRQSRAGRNSGVVAPEAGEAVPAE